MSEFLNIQILISTAAANPNRDDTGAPKQVTIGGVTRSRMSSQAMTRAKRLRFELSAGGDQISYRAKAPGFVLYAMTLVEEISAASAAALTDVEMEAAKESILRTVNELVRKDKTSEAAKTKAKDKKAKTTTDTTDQEATSEDSEDDLKDTAIWLAEPEIRAIAAAAVASVRAGDANVILQVLTEKRTLSLSIAAFGRMFANRPELQNEAAIQRAHAYTTHSTEIELDYFIAANDLGSTGAAHMAHAMLTGGVYYWHANIDRKQLWASWIPARDDAVVRFQLTELVTALMTGLPTGKQATTAPHTLPSAVLIGTSQHPNALHQCFEKPVTATSDGFLAPSIERLLAGQAAMNAYMPSWFENNQVSVVDCANLNAPAGIDVQPSLEATIAWCVQWLLDGRPAGGR